MKKSQKSFLALISLGALLLTGCSQESPVQITPTVNEPEPNQEIRARSVQWEEDRLFYLTEQGVYAFVPATGETLTLKSGDASEQQINQARFWLSPDKSKYILVEFHGYGSTLEIRDSAEDAAILTLDTSKYTEGVGEYSPSVHEAGWVDDDHIYLSTGFRLFIVDINSGEEVQVTEECSPVTTNVSGDMVAPYLDWARNVVRLGDKLYYFSNREVNDRSYQSIYVGDKTGERELLKNADLLMAVDDRSFLYTKTSGGDISEPFLYDIETGSSSLITEKTVINKYEEIYVLNDGKLAFMTGTESEGSYQGLIQGWIFDPVTLESEEFTIYNPAVPELNLPGSFSHFYGAYKQDNGYVFVYSVLESTANFKYYLYSTSSGEISEISGIGGYGAPVVSMEISPSGQNVALIKHKGDSDDFLLEVVKSEDLL